MKRLTSRTAEAAQKDCLTGKVFYPVRKDFYHADKEACYLKNGYVCWW
jgi:hypothetical protein